jgi:hypothetical protein
VLRTIRCAQGPTVQPPGVPPTDHRPHPVTCKHQTRGMYTGVRRPYHSGRPPFKCSTKQGGGQWVGAGPGLPGRFLGRLRGCKRGLFHTSLDAAAKGPHPGRLQPHPMNPSLPNTRTVPPLGGDGRRLSFFSDAVRQVPVPTADTRTCARERCSTDTRTCACNTVGMRSAVYGIRTSLTRAQLRA